MPIYGFTCLTCGHAFDRLQKVKDENPACPLCNKPTARQLSAPGFQLKGTGWYATDFRSKPK